MRSCGYFSLCVVAVLAACSDNGSGGGTASTAGGGSGGGGTAGVSAGGTAAGGSAGTAQGGSAGTSVAGAGGSGAGSGGAAGAAGSSGGTSGGGAGGAGGGAGGGMGNPGAVPSLGCGTAATDTPGTFVLHNTTAGSFDRSYYVRLPEGYDPMRAYPLMLIGPGCGGSGDMAIPVQNEAGDDAIVVGLNISSEASGRDCFMTESPESPELPYFDAVWQEVSAGYCVDTERVFYGGFSSGSWLAYLYGCARANVLRAHGNVAGGPAPIPDCPGPVAAIMIHDENDGSNGIGGGEAARARVLEQNNCTGTDTEMWDAQYPMCQKYTGCPAEYPVVWCQTSGVGHSPQDDLSAPVFWKFLMQLPPRTP